MLRGIALSGASGLLMGAGFVFPALFPLSLVGLLPLLFILRDSPARHAALYGSSFAFVLSGLSYFAIFWHILPVPWTVIDLPLPMQVAFVFAGWLYSVIAISLPLVAWCVLVRPFLATWRALLVAPSLWVLAELAQAYAFALVQYAPDVAVGPHFAVSFIGTLLADDLALLQAASIGGVFALSSIIIAVNIAMFLAVRGGAMRSRIAPVLVLLGSTWAGAHLYVARAPVAPGIEREIAVVSTRMIPPARQYGVALPLPLQPDEILRAAEGADILILPEGAAILTGKLRDALQRKSDKPRTVIDSRTTTADSRKKMEYFDTRTGASAYTSKYSLVPIGEYVPRWFTVFAKSIGYSDEFSRRTSSSRITSGEPPPPVMTDVGVVGALFCAEATSPFLYRAQVRSGAQFLVNAGSQIWYHDSRAVYAQMMRAAKIRAVESRRFFVQSSDTSPSFVLDPYGRVVARTSWGQAGVLRATIRLSDAPTPYTTRLGMWTLIVPILMVLCAIAPRGRDGIQRIHMLAQRAREWSGLGKT